MKKIILILVLIISPTALLAEEPLEGSPHWSLEVKGGDFMPAIDDWSQNYGKRYTQEYGGSLAYKVFRPLEVGIEGSFIQDIGQGKGSFSNLPVGKVTYKLYPVNVFVLARGVFSERQWVVPYVGGGWTRMFYKEEVQGQGTARGKANGYHARVGLQFLLDGLDQTAANNLYFENGVYHTYLFIEAKRTHAMIDTDSGLSVNLGGTSYLGGLLFEF